MHSKFLVYAHQSLKYVDLKGNRGCRIQRWLRKCWYIMVIVTKAYNNGHDVGPPSSCNASQFPHFLVVFCFVPFRTHVKQFCTTAKLSHWDPYAMHRGGCLELYYCNTVDRWSGPGGIQALSERPTGFLQCFDTVGLVIWPVKIVPDMTYNVFGGTLNLAESIKQSFIIKWHHCDAVD